MAAEGWCVLHCTALHCWRMLLQVSMKIAGACICNWIMTSFFY